MPTREDIELLLAQAAYYRAELAQATNHAERVYAEAMARDLEAQATALERETSEAA